MDSLPKLNTSTKFLAASVMFSVIIAAWFLSYIPGLSRPGLLDGASFARLWSGTAYFFTKDHMTNRPDSAGTPQSRF